MKVTSLSSIGLIIVFLLAYPGHIFAQTSADIVAIARPGVVFVIVETAQGLATGSGFVVNQEGLILTAYHVVEGSKSLTVVVNRTRVRATLMAFDEQLDIAVLSVGRRVSSLPLGASSVLRQGDEILVIGYPLADVLGIEEPTVNKGIISRLTGPFGLVQIDAPINPGNSGGPVLNLQGQVVGMVVGSLRAAQGINFAVPLGKIRVLLTRVAPQPASFERFAGGKLPFRAEWGSYVVAANRSSQGEEGVGIFDSTGELVRAVVDWALVRIEFIELDGRPPSELRVTTYSGGAHCCESDYLFTQMGGIRNVLIYRGGGSAIHSIRDINGDGRAEIVALSTALLNTIGIPYYVTPQPVIILGWNGRAYVHRTSHFPSYSLRQAHEYLREFEQARLREDEHAEDARRGALAGFYASMTLAGKRGEARSFVRRNAPPSTRRWFLQQEARILRALTQISDDFSTSQARLLRF